MTHAYVCWRQGPSPVDAGVRGYQRLERGAGVVLVDERPPQGRRQQRSQRALAAARLALEQQQHGLLGCSLCHARQVVSLQGEAAAAAVAAAAVGCLARGDRQSALVRNIIMLSRIYPAARRRLRELACDAWWWGSAAGASVDDLWQHKVCERASDVHRIARERERDLGGGGAPHWQSRWTANWSPRTIASPLYHATHIHKRSGSLIEPVCSRVQGGPPPRRSPSLWHCNEAIHMTSARDQALRRCHQQPACCRRRRRHRHTTVSTPRRSA